MSQTNTTFEYNGLSYEFDARDAEYAEKLESAVAGYKEAYKSLPKEGLLSVIYKAQCEMIRKFFDSVFEKGDGVKICGDRYHVTAHYDAYNAFMAFIEPQQQNIKSYTNVFSKYSNRQQRRAGAKAKKK